MTPQEQVVFRVGDIVEFGGAKGVVTRTTNVHCCEVDVRFDVGETKLYFTKEGKLFPWHKEPILKLIESPKKNE